MSAITDLAVEFGATGQPVRWPVPSDLDSSPAVAYRNRFALELSKKTGPEIAKSYVYLSVQEMERMLALATRDLLERPLAGVGLELGAGCGLLASVVAKLPEVRAVLAVEVCEEMAGKVIPMVARWV